MQLNYHLPDQNAVTLRNSKDLLALLEREGINIKMSTDWFELNKRDTAARAFTYAEIPQHRAQSFEKLMKVNKQIYATFKAACFAYGLLSDDKEWTHVIAEAPDYCNCGKKTGLLYQKIYCIKKGYFTYPALQLSDEQIRNYCLLEIQKLLNRHGRSLAEFQDLPHPNPSLLTNLDNRLIREALNFDVNKSRAEHEKLHSLLNPEQHLVYDKDEAPMSQRYAFEELDKTLRDRLGYKNRDKRNCIFGGMTVLLGGDFRQILPVIPKAKRPEVSTPIEQIVLETYLDFTTRQTDESYLKERAILTPRNDDADAINEFIFKKLAGVSMTYNSADEIYKASIDTADQHHLYQLSS
ncbi:ATP-dependent DNA helicase PIF1-like protein [Tanacetum coccineum]